ncbi:glycosyltransferase family 4 protein [Bacillus cereus group sp. BfR-BA-01400]|uniref:glycosyltransferase family 4 protein n=1 Tax=Bacillus cereus group sp. BfR-BA-01400 TaxID=2920334 RepID=UPI001F5A90FB
MRKLLVLNHFPTIFPPNTGGVLRYYHIYNQLSKFYDITLLSQKYTPELEKVEFSNSFREFKIPTDAIQHKIDQQLIAEGMGPRFSTHAALSCALIKETPVLFLKYYNEFYKNSDIIIHDSPFTLKYDINFDLDSKPRIYNSHNHESEFAKRIWYGKNARKYIKYVTRMEQYLVENATLVFATSEEDRESFLDSFYLLDRKRIKLAPNGIRPEEWPERKKVKLDDSRTTAFFIGSMHQPNIDIVNFITSKLAEECANIDFIIAGQCGDEFSDCTLPNVKILGEINETKKIQLFSEVDIAINPAFFGTGTKIKTLEFLSAGLPLLSTDVGVKGMYLKKGEHYFHASHKDFSHILNKISKDKNLLNLIASNGQKYINKNFSWEAIAQNIKIYIDYLY